MLTQTVKRVIVRSVTITEGEHADTISLHTNLPTAYVGNRNAKLLDLELTAPKGAGAMYVKTVFGNVPIIYMEE